MEPEATTALPLGDASLHFLHELTRRLLASAVTRADGTALSLQEGLGVAVGLLRASQAANGRILLIGNGGSASIASHLAVDMWKNGGLEALAFNDPSLLTCVSNDCGFENVFAEPIRRFARGGDLLVAVSSSGRSLNILRGVAAARERGCTIVGFSGFDADNPLRALGDLNFHFASHTYGLVEAGHLALLHGILDTYMGYPKPTVPFHTTEE